MSLSVAACFLALPLMRGREVTHCCFTPYEGERWSQSRCSCIYCAASHVLVAVSFPQSHKGGISVTCGVAEAQSFKLFCQCLYK